MARERQTKSKARSGRTRSGRIPVHQQRTAPRGAGPDPAELQRRLGNRGTQAWLAQNQAMPAVQRQSPRKEEEELLQRKPTSIQTQGDVAQSENRTGMPGRLKSGLEALSGMDLSGVRVHGNSSKPAQLNALAYTQGQDIHVGPGQEKHLHHEGWHAVQQMQGRVKPTLQAKGVSINDDAGLEREADVMGATALQMKRTSTTQERGHHEGFKLLHPGNASGFTSLSVIQRDLARQPPGRLGPPGQLTQQEIAEAIAYNNRRFGQNVTRQIQDIVGAQPTGRFDADTIHMIVEWQADFRLTVDGKIGLRTMREIVKEMIAEGMRNTAIWTIIDGHNMNTTGLIDIAFDRTVADNAATTGAIPGRSRVRVGPTGFSQGYEGLVHTIAHELDHVNVRLTGTVRRPEGEFRGETLEIITRGMLLESFAGMMIDAETALPWWGLMTVVEQRRNRARFLAARAEINRRFNAAPLAAQTAPANAPGLTRQDIVNRWNAIVPPL